MCHFLALDNAPSPPNQNANVQKKKHGIEKTANMLGWHFIPNS